ncbi:hypothetical protein FSP39_014944 [Pinctada imbricata]|uniref:DUF4795 domain-containing protein n=1 Tax=Pinctada imbricata TaxID=66713 RepID=A0AA88XSE5_PINIB|nr:hypothetical protein FSP39_014944 [Pinctada imbricata]
MESESRATPKVEKESDEANKDNTEKAGETSDESPVVKPDKEKETDKKDAKESSADGTCKTDTKKEEKVSTESKDEKAKEEGSDRPVSPRTGAIKRESYKLDEAIVKIFESEYKPDLEEVSEIQDELGNDLSQANDRIKTLALILNNQLHTIRDKIFALDNDLKRMAKGVEFALLRAKVAGMSDLDSDALSRAQQAILQLQAEVEKLHGTTKDIIEENERRSDQIDSLFKYCDKLQEVKADKEYVQMEVDVKADKRSLDNKVNHTLFDSTTNEINKMIKEILDKLAGNEESWKNTIKKFAEDIDGKLDRLELDPLKEWLESRLKALNDKLRKQQAQVEWTEDDAAGIRKQLIQRFHCISCDRPVDLVPTGPVPALPTHSGLPPTRSPRPYTTFELDQIRQHAKRMYVGIDKPGVRGPRNNVNFERAIAERQLARMRKSDLKAFLVHFGRDLEAFRQQREEAAIFASAEVSDYYATPRPCGGSHTMTYPHKRITRLSHLSHLFREEDGNIYPLYKEEVDVQGADGHIYKGRMGAKLEARLPVVTQAMERSRSPVTTSIRKTTVSPPPGHRVVHHPHARPSSARAPPPRASGRTESPRPQSAHPQGSREGTPRPDESSHMITCPARIPSLTREISDRPS